MSKPPHPTEPPSSYNTLPTRSIRVSHVPSSSPTATAVIQITLNRPQNHNAFTNLMMEEMVHVYNLIEADDRVKAVVVTGAGSKAFCAGADLDIGFLGGASKSGTTANQKDERDGDHRDGGGRVSLAIHNCTKPTIGAINGAAVGVGITMCLPMCIRVAYRKAKIGFVFSRRGIVMEACSSWFLPRLIGYSKALHLTTAGSVYPADSPLLGDLFTELVDTPDAALERALELAEDIAKNTSLVSTKMMRDLMYRGSDSAEGAHLLDSRVIYSLFGSKDNLDLVEGVKSFFEKRPPKFTGTMPQDAPSCWPWWNPVDVSSKRPSKL